MYIRVYIFGPGFGESIILEFPSDSKDKYSWGVVDCHSEDVLDFLQQEKKVKKLEFVCWTHPHADHYNGLPPLLQAYSGRIHRFWRFGGQNAHILMAFYKYFFLRSTSRNRLRTSLDKIENIFSFVLKQRKLGENSYKSLTDIHAALFEIPYRDNSRFRISSLSPSSQLAEKYTSQLGKCFGQLGGGSHLSFDYEKAVDQLHNSVSTVLLIEFGQTRLLLGADAENQVWEDICSSEERKNLPLPLCSHFVKVSHHGSENAYHVESWREISRQKSPYAVVTPFKGNQLPTNQGLSLLKNSCGQICLTATRKNFQYYPTHSKSVRRKYPWKTNVPRSGYCCFEFDHLGNLTNASLSETAVAF